jgi:hypothetical protein
MDFLLSTFLSFQKLWGPFSLSAAPLFAGKRRETFLLKKLT